MCWALDVIKACKGNKALYYLDEIFLKQFRTGSSLDAEFKFVVPKHVGRCTLYMNGNSGCPRVLLELSAKRQLPEFNDNK